MKGPFIRIPPPEGPSPEKPKRRPRPKELLRRELRRKFAQEPKRQNPIQKAAARQGVPPEVLGGWSSPVPAKKEARPKGKPHAPKPSPSPQKKGRNRAEEAAQERAWLNERRRCRRAVQVLLKGGQSLSGQLLRFDRQAIVLEVEGKEVVVYKRGVVYLR